MILLRSPVGVTVMLTRPLGDRGRPGAAIKLENKKDLAQGPLEHARSLIFKLLNKVPMSPRSPVPRGGAAAVWHAPRTLRSVAPHRGFLQVRPFAAIALFCY
jgi:hypothetical protein